MRYLAGVIGMAAALAASPAQALEELPPASNWTLDYADDSCALQRDFGTGDDLVHLEFRQFGPGNIFQAMLASDDYAMRSTNRRFSGNRPEIRWSPDEEIHRAQQYFHMRFDGRMRAVVFSETLRPGDDPRRYETWDPAWTDELRDAREAEVEYIDVENVFLKELRLQTGNMAAPMRALRTCLDELVTHWGIDAEAHRELQKPALPKDMQVWAQEVIDVYPREMLNSREIATLRIRLDVSSEGRATGCHLQSRVGEEGFEETACDILIDHARFTPALDAAGEAIDSFYVMSVHYRIG